jgi:hypothetical protein
MSVHVFGAVKRPVRVAFAAAVVLLPLIASYVMGGGVKMWHRHSAFPCLVI